MCTLAEVYSLLLSAKTTMCVAFVCVCLSASRYHVAFYHRDVLCVVESVYALYCLSNMCIYSVLYTYTHLYLCRMRILPYLAHSVCVHAVFAPVCLVSHVYHTRNATKHTSTSCWSCLLRVCALCVFCTYSTITTCLLTSHTLYHSYSTYTVAAMSCTHHCSVLALLTGPHIQPTCLYCTATSPYTHISSSQHSFSLIYHLNTP